MSANGNPKILAHGNNYLTQKDQKICGRTKSGTPPASQRLAVLLNRNNRNLAI